MDVCAKLVGVRRIQLYVVPGRYRDAPQPNSRLCGRSYQRKTEGPNRPGWRKLQIPLGRASRREILISLRLQQFKAPASPGAFLQEAGFSPRLATSRSIAFWMVGTIWLVAILADVFTAHPMK